MARLSTVLAAALALSVWLDTVALDATASAASPVASKPALTLDGARSVISSAKVEAKRLGAPGGVIAVVDDGGNLLALERLDGTFAAGSNVSVGKARTAASFKKPTKFFEDVAGNGDATLYFDSDEVASAFSKGAVLYDGNGGRNYMVHASRRDKAGQAEVHALDTDVIYVVDGNATFVTGGRLVGGKDIEADETRGSAIDGGTTRKLAKGDVVVVPNGTPHWFEEVAGPFTYFVVKVR